MIAKILAASPKFAGVRYNTNKIDRNKGELMIVANFGSLMSLSNLRPQDYINYLELVSAGNRNISNPEFHAVVSARNRMYNKDELAKTAVAWLSEMGYGDQPYLVVFHKDTENNHVHMVSTRVAKDGRKINAAFEKVRSQRAINKVLGYTFGMQYKFSTRAQFLLLLERTGYIGKDPDTEKLNQKIAQYGIDKGRVAELKNLLLDHNAYPNFRGILKDRFGLDLVFHSSEGKKPYGYTIIDHLDRHIYKGSEVLPLKLLLENQPQFTDSNDAKTANPEDFAVSDYIGPINISDDVDDQQIHGMRRRRQQKARTNTR
jgi:hypothetical protein